MILCLCPSPASNKVSRLLNFEFSDFHKAHASGKMLASGTLSKSKSEIHRVIIVSTDCGRDVFLLT